MADQNSGSGDGPAPQNGAGASAGALLGGDGQQQQAAGDGGQQQQQQQQAAGDGTGNGSNTGNDPNLVQSDWLKGFEGEDLGWIQNRGLQGKSADEAFKNLVTGFRNAEKRLGVPSDRLLQLPADKLAEGAMDSVWEALGRPKDAAGYELDAGDTDLTKSFSEALGETFFKAGLTKDQAQAVEGALEEFFGNEHTKSEEGAAVTQQAALQALKDEWGGEDAFNINLSIAKEAVKALGATKEEIEALESAFGEKGNAAVIRFFNRAGQKRGVETPYIAGDGSLLGLGATTPEAARAKMNEMKSDPKIAPLIRDSHLHPDNAEVKRYRALAALAAKKVG